MNLYDIQHFFKEQLNRGHIVKWQTLHNLAHTHELPIDKLEELKNWFEMITACHFLLPLKDNTEEIFFHDEKTIIIKTGDDRSKLDCQIAKDDFDLLLNHLAIVNGQNWNFANPYVSFNATLFDRPFRITLIHQSLSPQAKNTAFLRLLNHRPFPLEQYSHHHRLNDFITNKNNILIAGSTGSGKTTLMNSMINQVKNDEHIVILEDTFELHSPNQRTSRLLAGEISLDQLLSYSLRMSPDRILLGEIRSVEILTYLLAMNTGHRGMISSIHANSAKDALQRMAILYTTYSQGKIDYEMVLKLICQNIDFVVYMEDKKVVEIIEVFGSEKQTVFYDMAL
jgi:type IV secretion system protein VirB11